MTETLKPCPFCGATHDDPDMERRVWVSSDDVGRAAVRCGTCDVIGPPSDRGPDRDFGPGDDAKAAENWNRRTATPPSYLSDPEWEGMTIEVAFKRALAAEARADDLDGECREFRAEAKRLRVSLAGSDGAVRENSATIDRLNDKLAAAITRAEAAERRVAELEAELGKTREALKTAGAMYALQVAASKLPQNPLTGLPCDSLRPTCQQPGCGDCVPEVEAPTVHGIKLAVGQRWVWRTPGRPEAAPSMDSLVTDVGPPVWLSSPFSGGPDGDKVDSWSEADFRRFHTRLRFPEELTPPAASEPEAPIVHGVRLEKGQRWVTRGAARSRDLTIRAVCTHTVDAVCDDDPRSTGYTFADFAARVVRLCLPGEMEPAKVEAEPVDPYAWAKPGAWSVFVQTWAPRPDDDRSCYMLRLIAKDGVGDNTWESETVDGTRHRADAEVRRPATPEEAEKLEAEYQRNMAKRLPVVPATCGECEDAKPCDCSGPGVCPDPRCGHPKMAEANSGAMWGVVGRLSPPSWCPKRAPKETT